MSQDQENEVLDLRPRSERRKAALEEPAEIVAAVVPEAPTVEKTVVKLTPRKLGLPLEYRDPETGEVRKTVLISVVPDRKMKEAITRDTVKRTMGLPWGAIPDYTREMIVMRAQILIQIEDAPDWFDRWVEQDDVLADGVFGGCAKHTNAYFRGGLPAGLPGQGRPGMVVGALTPLPDALSGGGA